MYMLVETLNGANTPIRNIIFDRSNQSRSREQVGQKRASDRTSSPPWEYRPGGPRSLGTHLEPTQRPPNITREEPDHHHGILG